MKIIGFTINKITAEKNSALEGKLELKSGLNIENILEEDISFSNSKGIRFNFVFSIDYGKVGKIEIKGAIIAIDEKDESKEILKDWKKKKFNHPIKLSLFNYIMDKCNLKALELEDQIGLPLHIPFPKLAPAPKKQDEKNPANYAG